jgi:hypothetical protein
VINNNGNVGTVTVTLFKIIEMPHAAIEENIFLQLT